MKKITSEKDFLEITITKEIMEEAKERNNAFYMKYKHLGTKRKNKENQRINGYLAEVAIKKTFQKLKYSNNDEYDFLSINNKVKIDSKAQGCNSIPKESYVCTLYEEQKERDCDILIFSRVKNDHTKLWINGFIPKKEFLNKSKLIKKGTKNNNFTYDDNRYELEYKELYNPKLLI